MSAFQEQFAASVAQNGHQILVSKETDVMLCVRQRSFYHYYDFIGRIMCSTLGGHSDSMNVTPFSQLDPEVLATMRAKLVELGGNPPELAKPSAPARNFLSKQSVKQ